MQNTQAATVHLARVSESGWGDGHGSPGLRMAQFAVAEEHYFVLAAEPPVEINSDGHGAEVGVIVDQVAIPGP